MSKPFPLQTNDWKEILELPEVREKWELDENDTVESISSNVYAAKFYYSRWHEDEEGVFYLLTSGQPDGQNMMIQKLDGVLFVVD